VAATTAAASVADGGTGAGAGVGAGDVSSPARRGKRAKQVGSSTLAFQYLSLDSQLYRLKLVKSLHL